MALWEFRGLTPDVRAGLVPAQCGATTGVARTTRNPEDPKRLALADKLSALAPVLTIDDEDKSPVYLEIVGAKQSVKANWATLVGGGKVHWLDGRNIMLDGMKQHVRIQKTLPCGWVD